MFPAVFGVVFIGLALHLAVVLGMIAFDAPHSYMSVFTRCFSAWAGFGLIAMLVSGAIDAIRGDE